MIYIAKMQKIKKKDTYRIILIEKKRHATSGKVKALFGWYNPHTKQLILNINRWVL